MKYEIKHRFAGTVQFTAEINCDENESDPIKLGLAVKWGLKNKSNLRNADFSNADLRGAYLSGANLYGANLGNAYLSNANLSNADFSKANLSNAYLGNANLSNANLSNAYLGNADFSNAYLGNADFSNADFSNADFSKANLSNADFRGANLGDSDLISGGQRLDGYEFYGQIKDGELWIKAGCRYFSIDEARRHWNETRKDTTLGDETFLRLDMIESIAKTRFGEF